MGLLVLNRYDDRALLPESAPVLWRARSARPYHLVLRSLQWDAQRLAANKQAVWRLILL